LVAEARGRLATLLPVVRLPLLGQVEEQDVHVVRA
jgi:hypothetical protein